MADDRDDSQRTEEPTQRRLDEAEKHGDIVKSQEVTTFATLLGGTLVIAMFGRSTAMGFANNFRVFLEQPDQIAVDPSGIVVLLHHILLAVAAILGPVFAVLIAVIVSGHVLQHRPSIALDRIMPDLAKLSPASGLKRIFGFDGVINLGKGLLKIAVVGFVLWTVLWPERGRLDGILTHTPEQVMADIMHLLMKILFATLSVLAVLAVLDYFLQRYRFLQRNRMSKQELKEEFRQTEGDPAVKSKIKQIRQERSRRRMMAAVPEATVVITNPTHFAVALKYESGKMAAPVCVAKGVDALAFKIREVAEEHEIPIVENPPLARALFATVELDEPIPAEHYKAVAQVIGYVMKLTGKMRAN
ncbi:MAG TPA: flagellar biosynthesis protein FlhB [Rhizomicrobium sp.]|nr:flagellar biosynthesis protein FlhB [Rhizomicrobium sp.]